MTQQRVNKISNRRFCRKW